MVAWVHGAKKGTYAENTFSPEKKCFKVCEQHGSKDTEECFQAKVALRISKTYLLFHRISATIHEYLKTQKQI